MRLRTRAFTRRGTCVTSAFSGGECRPRAGTEMKTCGIGGSAQCHLSFPLDPSFGPKSPAFASGKRRASARRQARGSILGRSETCPTSFAVRRVRATMGQFENLSGIGRFRLFTGHGAEVNLPTLVAPSPAPFPRRSLSAAAVSHVFSGVRPGGSS